MSANANIVDPVRGKSSLVRPKFSPGLLLRDDDLSAGIDYTRNLSRLMFRSLFGAGVICGLEVEAETRCGKLVVTVGSGIGLTCLGDPVQVPEPRTLTVDPTCGKELPPRMWVTLCHTDRCCAPRTAVCGCDDEDGATVCTREQEGFEIRIVKEIQEKCLCTELPLPPPPQRDAPQSTCWCADPCETCHRQHYGGVCGCECCDGDCIVLAVLNGSVTQAGGEYGAQPAEGVDQAGGNDRQEMSWTANHSVRRFVRPVLMRDPVVHKEQYPQDKPCEKNEVVPAGQQQEQAMRSDIALSDEAAERAGQAARMALRKGAEVRAAIAAGRVAEAEAAARTAADMAVEAEMSAKAVAEKASDAAAIAQREVGKLVAEREAAEKAFAEKVAASDATADSGAKPYASRAKPVKPPAKPAAS